MGVISRLHKDFKLEQYDTLSEIERIKGEEKLLKFAESIGFEVPKEYVEIAGESKGLEIHIGDNVYIRVWDAEWCVEMNEAYNIPEFSPNSLAVGDDEGGNCLIYLEGIKGNGLYLSGYGDLGAEGAEYVSKTLEDLLVRGEGVEKIIGEDY